VGLFLCVFCLFGFGVCFCFFFFFCLVLLFGTLGRPRGFCQKFDRNNGTIILKIE